MTTKEQGTPGTKHPLFFVVVFFPEKLTLWVGDVM